MLSALAAAFTPVLIALWFFRSWTTPPLRIGTAVGAIGAGVAMSYYPVYWLLNRIDRKGTQWIALWLGFDRGEYPYSFQILHSLLVNGLPEELYKWLILVGALLVPNLIRNRVDAVALGGLLGAGHALGEVLHILEDGFVAVVAIVGIKTGLLSSLGVIMGRYVAASRLPGWRSWGLLLGLAVPVLLHGTYNFGVSMPEQLWNAVLEEQPWEDELMALALTLVGLVIWFVVVVWAARILWKCRADIRPNEDVALDGPA
jgi:RsiW-degrading membrane proteinase PrsW (M82 family)